MAAENAQIEPGDTVAVWGCGPVAQFAIRSAWMLGAGRVIAIDRVPERLADGPKAGKAETINFEKPRRLRATDGDDQGRGPDRCIDAVGRRGPRRWQHRRRARQGEGRVGLATDRPHVLREAIMCCRKGGTVSIPGVYIGFRTRSRWAPR